MEVTKEERKKLVSSPASFQLHPIHPMIVPFPIGFWGFSFISDLIYLRTKNAIWNTIAHYTMGGGIIGAALAAIPGTIDLINMKPSNAKNKGLTHMGLNVAILGTYIYNFLLRKKMGPGARFPIMLSMIAFPALAVSGFLGQEMVYVHGRGVAPVETKMRGTPEGLQKSRI